MLTNSYNNGESPLNMVTWSIWLVIMVIPKKTLVSSISKMVTFRSKKWNLRKVVQLLYDNYNPVQIPPVKDGNHVHISIENDTSS